jgi:hypothetical protein
MNWGNFFAALQLAADQAKANIPPPAIPPPTDAQIAEGIETAVPKVAAALAIVEARPGLVTAAGTVLGALPFSRASAARDFVYGLPGLLGAVVKYGPVVAGLIRDFAPAATGIAGDDPADSRGR